MPSRVTPSGSQSPNTPGPSSFANGIAGGCVGYITRTSNAGPTSSGTAVDITGVTFSFTPSSATRLIRLEFWCSGVTTSDGTTYGTIAIQEGANVLAYGRCGPSSVVGISGPTPVYVQYLWRAPSASAHTIRATILRSAGAGSLTVAGGTDNEMFLAAHDVGPNF